MILNQRQVQIIEALYGLHVDLARGDEDQRRQLTRMIAEQLCFEFGNDWGTKAQTSTHPPSKDSISFRLNSLTFDNWDWQNGTTKEPQVSVGQAGTTIIGQFFIQVEPVNHLGNGGNGNGSDEVLKKLDDMQAQLNTMQETLNQQSQHSQQTIELLQQILMKPVNEPFPITWPEYKGRLLGFNVTLTPHPKQNP